MIDLKNKQIFTNYTKRKEFEQWEFIKYPYH